MYKLLLFLFCILTFATFGQTNRFDIGAEGGFSVASLRGNDFIDKYHSTKTGYSGGLFFQYNFRKIISMRTGMYYERKGSSFEFWTVNEVGENIGVIQGYQNFDYLTVPLLLRATFGKKLTCFINTGPYIGFLLKETEHTDAVQTVPETNANGTEFFNRTEVGLSAGIGLSYILKQKFSFSFEVRDNLGLTNTSKQSATGNGPVKTNALNFLFGFGYKFGDVNSLREKK
jgi:hypothetical protein